MIIWFIKNEKKRERQEKVNGKKNRKEWHTIIQEEIVRASVPFY